MENPFRVPGVFAPVISTKNHKSPSPGSGVPLRLGDAFCARRVLLLVFVDLDIAGRVFILNKQQGGGQGNGQRGEQCEQHFENFHGLKPPWKSLARSGGRSASEC